MSEAFKFLGGFILIFTVLWFAWYFTGGPQKEDSNKAFIKLPETQNFEKEKYGTIERNIFTNN